MSQQELEFYKCKLCDYQLLAGKYCIDCAKKKVKDVEDKIRKGLNTNPGVIGYPFIQQDECLTYDTGTATTVGTRANTIPTTGGSATGYPIWTNFTAGGNATNVDFGAATTAGQPITVSNSSAMDLGFGTSFSFGQKHISKKRKISRHQ